MKSEIERMLDKATAEYKSKLEAIFDVKVDLDITIRGAKLSDMATICEAHDNEDYEISRSSDKHSTYSWLSMPDNGEGSLTIYDQRL